MKPKPCAIIINNWIGYCFETQYFPSINQAYKYGKKFLGGVWFRIFDLNGKIIKCGYCKPD
jgi:hypothetical protein